MFRKISATIFMLVMALLITLKHPVLGYCLCLDSYFTNDCVCKVVDLDQKSAVTPDCADCCTAPISTAQVDSEKQKPCDDCTKRLNINVSDFVWNASNQLPDIDQLDLPEPPAYASNSDVFTAQTAIMASRPIRGDPPAWLSPVLDVSQGRPLYLRHSVLIL